MALHKDDKQRVNCVGSRCRSSFSTIKIKVLSIEDRTP